MARRTTNRTSRGLRARVGTTTAMNIRAATPEDAPAVAALLLRCWQAAYRGLVPDAYLDALDSEQWSNHIRESVTSGTERTFVAERDAELIGLLTVGECRDEDVASDSGEIWGLYVSPAHWREGVGTALCRHGETILSASGHAVALLWVFEGNTAGRRFWEAVGFEFDGSTRTPEQEVLPPAVRYRKSISCVLPAPRLLQTHDSADTAADESSRS